MRLTLSQAYLLINMSYQSFLSAMLEIKYYTFQEIRELRLTIQRNSGLKITSTKQSQGQILLSCPNRHSQGCPFLYMFQKVQILKNLQKFQLLKSIQKHSIQCQASRSGKTQDKKSQKAQNLSKSTNLIKSSDMNSQVVKQSLSLETSASSPVSKQSIMNIAKLKAPISQNIQKRLYTEEQFSLLKKQLELQSRGPLSKSTQFESEPNGTVIKRLQFHCKMEKECPYEAILTLCDESDIQELHRSKKVYSLTILNVNHLPQCHEDEQIISFNENTMKIDRQIDLLTRIIQENSDKLKPKEILGKLALELGENQNFIYDGLQKKILKRAIKKYFDNCVAKVRNKVFSPVKNPKTSSSIPYQPISKRDEDYFC